MAEGQAQIVAQLRQALDLRRKYECQQKVELPKDPKIQVEFAFESNGLMCVRRKGQDEPLFQVPSLDEYYGDMASLHNIRSSGPVTSYCYTRLRLMQTKFELYSMVAGDQESQEAMDTGHRDFYNVRKVDTHIHHSAAMNAKHLLRFMKKKLKTYGSDVVDTTNGKARTLLNVFEDMGVSWKDMSIDRLQVWADKSCLHRFDRFNNKYSPLGMNDLRTIFLKTDNPMGGRYLAELTRELIDDLEDSKYQHVEWRLSIYGRKRNEWDILSNWVLGADGKGLGGNKELLSPNLRWMIQIPRLFGLYKSTGQLNNFGEMLENIFAPMFEATINPEAHPQKAKFLANISGFDTVDDESKSQSPIDRTFSSKARTPGEWDLVDNPSYKYYSYFIQTNIRLLNNLRQLKGLNTFAYRPHAGEAGEVHHLDTAFLLADGINHGLNLRKAPSLQYLFYLAQIGLAMSPCSNNQLFLAYEKSPFPVYFARGLNVSLSTDDPLMFHQTREPLMEEYSIAKQLWHFTAVDLCEMARNSVLQSGFPDETKAAWLGCSNFAEDNVPSLSNVPALRVRFRRQVLSEELLMLSGKVSNSEDVGGICSVLLMSPTSRRKRLEGDALEDAFMPSGTTSMTLPRVAALPGEDLEFSQFANSTANGGDAEAFTPHTGSPHRAGLFPEGAGITQLFVGTAQESGIGQTKRLTPTRSNSGSGGDMLLKGADSAGSLPRGLPLDGEEWLQSIRSELLMRSTTMQAPGVGVYLVAGLAALAGSLGGALVASWFITRRQH